MSPIDGAVKAVKVLHKHYDVFILSTAPWKTHRHGLIKGYGLPNIFMEYSVKR